MKIMKDEWPKDRAWPGTEILDKPTGSLYRYHKDRSVHHAVYTYRAADSANETALALGGGGKPTPKPETTPNEKP